MALRGMVISDEIEYVSPRDPSRKLIKVPIDPAVPNGEQREEVSIETGASVFRLRPLPPTLMAWVYDNTVARDIGGKIQSRYNETNLAVVKYGLTSVDNFHIDKAGNNLVLKPVKAVFNGVEYSALPDEALQHFGVDLIAEIAEEIKRISGVTAVEAKKSEGASSPSA